MKIILSIILIFLSAQSFADTKLDLALYCELKNYSYCNPEEKETTCNLRGVKLPETLGNNEPSFKKGTLVIKDTDSGVKINTELIILNNYYNTFSLIDWEASDTSYLFKGSLVLKSKPSKTPNNYTYFKINRYTGELYFRTDYDNTEDSPHYQTYTYDCKKIEKKF